MPKAPTLTSDLGNQAVAVEGKVHQELLDVSNHAVDYIRAELDTHKQLLAHVTSLKSQIDSLHNELSTVGETMKKDWSKIVAVEQATAEMTNKFIDSIKAEEQVVAPIVSRVWSKLPRKAQVGTALVGVAVVLWLVLKII